MSCPKRDETGTWQCGRIAGHPGAHLSLTAERQVRLLLGRVLLDLPEATGQALHTLRVARRRYERILNGPARQV